MNDEIVPRRQQIPGHGKSHEAESGKADFHAEHLPYWVRLRIACGMMPVRLWPWRPGNNSCETAVT